MPSPTPSGQSVQERYAPHHRCFGCGPANDQGPHLRSFPVPPEAGGPPDELGAEFPPSPHHLAFDGIVSGGIIGACSTPTATGRRWWR